MARPSPNRTLSSRVNLGTRSAKIGETLPHPLGIGALWMPLKPSTNPSNKAAVIA